MKSGRLRNAPEADLQCGEASRAFFAGLKKPSQYLFFPPLPRVLALRTRGIFLFIDDLRVCSGCDLCGQRPQPPGTAGSQEFIDEPKKTGRPSETRTSCWFVVSRIGRRFVDYFFGDVGGAPSVAPASVEVGPGPAPPAGAPPPKPPSAPLLFRASAILENETPAGRSKIESLRPVLNATSK